MKRILLFSVLIILFSSACKKETTLPEPASPNDNVPYWKLGNYWSYYKTSSPFPASEYVKIVGKKQERTGGFSYEFYVKGSFKEYHYYEDGFLIKYNEDIATRIPYFKHLDAKAGDTWEDSHNTYRLESVNDTVKVRAGVYVCKRVLEVTKDSMSGPGPGKKTYKYYSDQVGLIKCTGWMETYELEETNIK